MAYFNINHHQHEEEMFVVENRTINASYYVLKLKSEFAFPQIKPGQFVNILVDDSATTFLRRPISIYDVDYEQNTLDLLILIAGEGTRKLSLKKVGDKVNLLFPLGQGFTWDESTKKVLLIGGGVGLAPLLYLGKELVKEHIQVHTLIGGRSADYIIEKERFESLGQVSVSTDDGSLGEAGLLTVHSIMKELGSFDKIYTCGPDPMMKAVARMAKEAQVACEVSLENLMACGIGSCLCCVEDTTTGHRCACTEGPVFNIDELKWNSNES
jgi:dihydroorotate dehydrogenase electron transfer subunit